MPLGHLGRAGRHLGRIYGRGRCLPQMAASELGRRAAAAEGEGQLELGAQQLEHPPRALPRRRRRAPRGRAGRRAPRRRRAPARSRRRPRAGCRRRRAPRQRPATASTTSAGRRRSPASGRAGGRRGWRRSPRPPRARPRAPRPRRQDALDQTERALGASPRAPQLGRRLASSDGLADRAEHRRAALRRRAARDPPSPAPVPSGRRSRSIVTARPEPSAASTLGTPSSSGTVEAASGGRARGCRPRGASTVTHDRLEAATAQRHRRSAPRVDALRPGTQ